MSFTKGVLKKVKGIGNDSRKKSDALGYNMLKNNLKRLADEWESSGDELIRNEAKKIHESLGDIKRQPDESKSPLPLLLCEILAAGKSSKDKAVLYAIEVIKEVCRSCNYANPKLDKNESNLNLNDNSYIKTINKIDIFANDKISGAVLLSNEKDALSDEPLGCYVRPGILKTLHQQPVFNEYPKIVLYIDQITKYAEDRNLDKGCVLAFVYLYQIIRVYFDRYPYANLLEYMKWDIHTPILNGTAEKITKSQDSIIRPDKLNAIERPIVAMAALHYAKQIGNNIYEAGQKIISDKDLYKKWPSLFDWHQTGLKLYHNGDDPNRVVDLIKLYRNTAILFSGDFESLLKEKNALL